MLREEARPKMKVYFGRTHGEKTLGEIVKCNPTRAKVKTLEERGEGRGMHVGSVWNVPYDFITPADPTAKATEPAKPAPVQAMTFNPFQPHEDICIMEAIGTIYGHLSPENLSCDGEASLTHMRRVQAECQRKLRGLFAALGRTVSESDYYAWSDSRKEWEKKREAQRAAAK